MCVGLLGHGADVKCIDWHPSKALVVSGSKDNQQPVKLWDPKAGQGISTLYDIQTVVNSIYHVFVCYSDSKQLILFPFMFPVFASRGETILIIVLCIIECIFSVLVYDWILKGLVKQET